MAGYYPAFLALAGRPCVVVGGGEVAQRKVSALLECAAQVTVVAPHLAPGLAALAQEGRIRWVARGYRPGDLEGAFLAIIATDDPQVNQAAWQEAEQRHTLANVVDDPTHCHFIVPAVVRRGDLVLAVSTGGKSPALAKRVREELEAAFGPEYGLFLQWLGDLRERVKQECPDPQAREALWRALAESDALRLLSQGQVAAARARVEEILRQNRLAQAQGSS